MKLYRSVFFVAFFVLVSSVFCSVVIALDEDEATVSVKLSSQMTYRGAILGIRIVFESKYHEELTIYNLGVNFDWMVEDAFIGYDLSDNPAIVPAYGSYTSGLLTVSIPETATDGLHFFYVGIDGLQGETTGFSWDSPIQTLTVQGNEEEFYMGLQAVVANGITEATTSQYQSGEALSLVEQARLEHALAISLWADYKTADAISKLEAASRYLDQAKEEEQNYVESKRFADMLVIIFVVALLAVLVVALLLRRRRQKKIRRRKTIAIVGHANQK